MIHNVQSRTNFFGFLPHSSRLLLFVSTDELYVFDFPLDSLHDNAFFVTESDMKPVLLQDKWPEVYQNVSKFMTRSKDGMLEPFSLYTYWDSKHEYIIFREADTPVQNTRQLNSVIYDVLANVTFNQTNIWNLMPLQAPLSLRPFTDWPRLVVSSQESNVYYEMFFLSTEGHLHENTLYKFEVKGNSTPQQIDQINQPDIRLCINTSASEIYFSNMSCKEIYPDTITGGYLFQDKFYLFTYSDVIIFESTAMNQLNRNFPLVRVPFKDWIRCNESSSWWVYILAIVGFVIIVLCALIAIAYKCPRKIGLPAVLP